MNSNCQQNILPSYNLSQINNNDFENSALSVMRFQYENVPIYREYIEALRINIESINRLQDIPFLPIHFFKTHTIVCSSCFSRETLVFESSGTSGGQNSKHYVCLPEIYEKSFLSGFQKFYGLPKDYVFLCLLPSYLERQNSSLVYMAQKFVSLSQYQESGFYLNEWSNLASKLQTLQNSSKKTILLGVSFALIDFAEKYPMNLSNVIVMETGGMKGRKKEWLREEVHDFLQKQWQLNQVHSEYGMTELLSQAYSAKNGIFYPSNSMKVFVRDVSDPFDVRLTGSGLLNVIDLSNIYSSAFIATEDIGRVYEDGGFEVMGRADYVALRGCNLMYSSF